MKPFFIYIIILWLSLPDISRTGRVNQLKKEAKKAFLSEDYETASARFGFLVDSLDIQDAAITINLANALYRQELYEEAAKRYEQTRSHVGTATIISASYNQSGIIKAREQKYEEAIDLFKDALRKDPDNEEARYNYELLMKIMNQNQSQNQQNQQPEPSEYAKRLKKAAEKLAQEGRFTEAYQLMQDGLKVDVTVGTFQDFINRLGDVADIDQKY